MEMSKGLLIVVSAPSGCGKGTILGEVLKDPAYYYSVSATTRAPREGEVNGVQYHFLTREQFEENIAQDMMLEYAEYCGNYYGTPLAPINENLENGRNVILEIEVQGAMQVRKLRPDAVFVFIAPPSVETLRERLVGRGTEPLDVIEERVAQAEREIGFAQQYDYIVVNDVLEEAISDFKAIVRAESCKVKQD
ncbi:MAG: guanylate kinase [Oscillospiraceae bacterium]|nr:guanylate kinase [Oscillospiraceae bacterium]MBQ9111408.1 guanylate kinase [Oscillospiraceae bacterium]